MRVSKKSGEKVAQDSLDPWFDKDDSEVLTWQMYAKTCQHLLAKYLAGFLAGQGKKSSPPGVLCRPNGLFSFSRDLS